MPRKNAAKRRAEQKSTLLFLRKQKSKFATLPWRRGATSDTGKLGYPHFYYLDGPLTNRSHGLGDKLIESVRNLVSKTETFSITGDRVRPFLNYALSSNVENLKAGEAQPTRLYTPKGLIEGVLICVSPLEFQLRVADEKAGLAAAWLRDLSDGYVAFGDDVRRKLPGPIIVRHVSDPFKAEPSGASLAIQKPFFIGIDEATDTGEPLPAFTWAEQEGELRRTPIYEVHKQLGAKIIPFAGWEMPVWYTSVVEEHLAVRQAAGLFDVAHMGVYQVEGVDAANFLDSVVGNDIGGLRGGRVALHSFLNPGCRSDR